MIIYLFIICRLIPMIKDVSNKFLLHAVQTTNRKIQVKDKDNRILDDDVREDDKNADDNVPDDINDATNADTQANTLANKNIDYSYNDTGYVEEKIK